MSRWNRQKDSKQEKIKEEESQQGKSNRLVSRSQVISRCEQEKDEQVE